MGQTERPAGAPRNSAGAAPVRRPDSIRRTSSIDTVWPEGRTGNLAMTGRARDVFTPSADGDIRILAEDVFHARLQWDRTIVEIEASPSRPQISGLIGAKGGGYLRQALQQVVPEERKNATPLYLILDDISGASLVAGWAFSRWNTDWVKAFTNSSAYKPRNMEGICSGFRPGSSALNPDGTSSRSQSYSDVLDLRRPDDPEGWHVFTVQEDVGMRRARRIDVWMDDVIHVDSMFQDSATNPQGGRTAVHEYGLTATANPVSLKLLSVRADPRVLPYAECPAAALNVGRMLGTPLPKLREKVLEDLKGTAGCTHLNDALRALAEVPMLVERLKQSEKAAA
jgi:Protein of unknown function (DUF2889)